MAEPAVIYRSIPVSRAVSYSVLCTVLYVGILYVVPGARVRRGRSKDHPGVIARRIGLSLLTCAASAALLLHVGQRPFEPPLSAAVRLIGLRFDVSTIAKALLLVAVLFAGPLYEYLVVDGGLLSWPRDAVAELASMRGLRNYVAGPLTEEFVFRGCICSLHLIADVPLGRVILLTPLYFAIAHAHHVYERVATHGRAHLGPALIVALVQLGYTSIFGWLANFLLVKTGSIWPPVAVHAFCNAMGLPRVHGKVGGSVAHTGIYYTLLVGGAIAFARLAPTVAPDTSLFEPAGTGWLL